MSANRRASSRKFAPLLALACIGLLLPLAPQTVSAAAQEVDETFDSYADGKLPCTTPTLITPCTNAYATVTNTGGAAQVQSSVKDGATGKSLGIAGTSGGLDFATSSTDLCYREIDIAIAASTASNSNIGFRISSFTGNGVGDATHSGVIYNLQFAGGSTGSVTLQRLSYNHGTVSIDSAGPLVFATTFAANTFYHFTILCPPGPSAGTIAIGSQEATALGNAGQTHAVLANTGADFSPATHLHFYATGSGNTQYFDNLVFTPPPPLLQPAATTVDTFNLVGFDIDPQDRAPIARVSGAAPGTTDIKVFDPLTLALRGASPMATACNRSEGVMAYSQDPPGRGYVGFLDCASGGSITNALRIRDPLLQPPDQSGTICTDFCDIDLTTADSAGRECNGAQSKNFPPSANHIGTISFAPISWQNGLDPSGLHPKNALIAFAYSDDSNGNIGAWAIQQDNNGDDKSCGLSIPFAPIGATVQICTWAADDGHDYMAAVSGSAVGKVWRMDVSRTTQGVSAGAADPTTEPFVNLVQVYSFQTPYGQATGVDCARNYVATVTSGGSGTNAQVAMFKVLGSGLGTLAFPAIQNAANPEHAVALSRNLHYLAYLDSTTSAAVVVASNNVTDSMGHSTPIGTTVTRLAFPSGVTLSNFKWIMLDDTARWAFLAFSSKISRYDLSNAGVVDNDSLGTRSGKCIASNGTLYDCSSTNAASSGSTGPFGIDLEAGAQAGGISVLAYSTFLGILGTLLIAAIFAAGSTMVGALFTRRPETLARVAGYAFLVGLPIGFGWMALLGFFSPGFIFFVVFVLAVILVLVVMFRRRGGGE